MKIKLSKHGTKMEKRYNEHETNMGEQGMKIKLKLNEHGTEIK